MLDCIIVGGGVAGLAAARRLTEAGLAWVLFESRQRLGGRVFTTHDSAGHPVELGAEFVHGEAKEVRELVSLGNLTAVETESSFAQEREGRFRLDRQWWDDVATVSRRAQSTGHDRSVDEFLSTLGDLPERMRVRAQQFFESFDAADTAALSEHSISGDTGAAAETVRIAEGYSSLVQVLRQTTRVESLVTGSRVRRIEWTRNRVSVQVEGCGEATARTIIVAVPLAVLGSEKRLEWRPRPPLLAHLDDAVRPGHVARVTVAFREPFWFAPQHRHRFEFDPAHLGFFTLSSSRFATWWSAGARPHLVAWAGGAPARRLLERNVGEVGEQAVEELASVFGPLDVDSVHAYDWSSDPDAQMAYSWVPAGGGQLRTRFSEALDQTVMFCGEAFAPDAQIGTVDGAIASGYRAAAQVIAAVRTR